MRCLLFVVCCVLFICLLFVVCCLLFVVFLYVAYYVLVADCWLLLVVACVLVDVR